MTKLAELREEGGGYFARGLFAEARDVYQQAVDLAAALIASSSSDSEGSSPAAAAPDKQLVAALFSNLAACNIQLGEWNKAVVDAKCAIKLAPRWAKGYYRLACALYQLDQRGEAIRALDQGLVFEPDSKELRSKRQEWVKEEEELRAKQAAAASPWVLVRSARSSSSGITAVPSCALYPAGTMEGGRATTVLRSPLLSLVGLEVFGIILHNNAAPSASASLSEKDCNEFVALFLSPAPARAQKMDGCVNRPGGASYCGDAFVLRADGAPVSVHEVHALHDFLKTTRDRLAEDTALQVSRDILVAWQVSYNLLARQVAASDPFIRPVSFVEVDEEQEECLREA